jgi:type VI secretion system protein ImpG
VADSPERITVTNVTNPTGFSTPALGKDAMWKIVGHARLNLHAILDKDNLKELLQVYLPEGAGDPARVSAARRRLLGIEDVLVLQDTRMVRGTRIQGQIIKLQLQQDFFAGNGDLMLFGEMLLPFFAGLIGLNSYVTLVVTNPNSGAQFEWPTLIAPGLML